MPYKAREVLAKLQRAGFVIKRQSVLMSFCVIRMAGKIMWPCIRAIFRLEPFVLFLSKPLYQNWILEIFNFFTPGLPGRRRG